MTSLARLAGLPDDAPERLSAEWALIGAPLEARGPWAGVEGAGPASSGELDPVTVLVTLHERITAWRGGRAGAVATPSWLARIVAERALAAFGGRRPGSVLEPCCGAGALLGAWATVAPPATAAEWLSTVRGEELDAGTASVARRVVWLALARAGLSAPWPPPAGLILCTDALRSDAEGDFELVLGNPPYVFGEHVAEDVKDLIGDRFELSSGQVDVFRVMWEATLRRVRPGGIHAFLVPDAVLARDDLGLLRRYLRREAELVELVRCGAPFVDGYGRRLGVGAVLVVVRRRGGSARRIAVVRVREATADQGLVGAGEFPASAVPSDGGPWPIGAPSWWLGEAGLRAALCRTGRRLGAALLEGREGLGRGEELGKRALVAPGSEGAEPILVGGDVSRGHVRSPSRWVPSAAVRKPHARVPGPRVLVVKTGSTPVAAADGGGTAVLQSVYALRPGPGVNAWALAAVVSSVWSAVWACSEWTGVRALHPQLTQANLRALPLPDLEPEGWEALAALSQEWHALPRGEEVALTQVEEAMDRLIGRGFGLDLDAWKERLESALVGIARSQVPRWVRRG